MRVCMHLCQGVSKAGCVYVLESCVGSWKFEKAINIENNMDKLNHITILGYINAIVK